MGAAADNVMKYPRNNNPPNLYTKNTQNSNNLFKSKIQNTININKKINHIINLKNKEIFLKNNAAISKNTNYKSKSIDIKNIKTNNNYYNNFIYNNYYNKFTNNNYINQNNNIPSYNNYINNNTNIDNNLMKFEDVSRNPIFINLLHYDENLTNEENQFYYKYFKLNVVGGYYGMDNFITFTNYIEAILKSKVFLRYILIISGSDSNKILNYCYNFKFIDEIIIFCFIQNKYDYLLSNSKIKLVTTSFNDVILYLKNKSYSDKELDMSNQIPVTPLITFYEYEKCYFAIHRMIAKFFGD